MTKESVKRSPLFYIGDKYKLVAEIKRYFPQKINKFVEPFVGGGSVFMNVDAGTFLLNDIDPNVIALHKHLSEQAGREEEFFLSLWEIIKSYGLSCSYLYDVVPDDLKEKFPKTYFAKYNKDKYCRLREDFNRSDRTDVNTLYLLLIYGFNRMLRFNSRGDFNLPVGNVDFNLNTVNALKSYFEEVRAKHPKWYNNDFRAFLHDIDFEDGDFVYFDPPYLITFSEYNKLWSEKDESDLLDILNALSAKGVMFAVSNVTHYKGRVNGIFLRWSASYNVHPIKSNYISYHDNSIKTFNEVLVTNY